MTPEQIEHACEHARAALAYRPIHLKPATENEVLFARALLALTKQFAETQMELSDARLEALENHDLAVDWQMKALSRVFGSTE